MSIIEKKTAYELSTEFAIPAIFELPTKPNQVMQEVKDEKDAFESKLIELQDVHSKNVQLALKLRELGEKYKENKNQYRLLERQRTEYHEQLVRMNGTVKCPQLNKIVGFADCEKACSTNICDRRWACSARIDAFKNWFRIT